MIIAWNGETMPALSLQTEIATVARAGFTGLEFFIPKLNDYLAQSSVEDLAQLLATHGLAPVAMNGIENINLRTPADFRAVKEETQRIAQVCGRLGCATIVVVPSPQPAGIAWPEVKADTVMALQALSEVAAPHGVGLGLEFLAPADCSVRTLAQAEEIVAAAGRKNVGIVVDSYHFHVGGSTWESLAQADVRHILLVHVNDVEDLPRHSLTDACRLLPGEGVLPLSRLVRALRDKGYDGAYSLEVMRPSYRLRDPLEYASDAFQRTQNVVCAA